MSSCQDCHLKRGRNRQIVHYLRFYDEENLRRHLNGEFPEDKPWVDSRIRFWHFAQNYYGQAAREKYAPLWLVYLEAHGVMVHNRAEAIMKHRGHRQLEES